ncbi:ATP-binding cassette domain-containing protein [Marinomonas rhizomae]|uniref:ATP-binding cassette subfamily C protein LapB n=1 Tax=Marinomonas rhizomae TaxID=491948 RepID=A0A366J8R2_9GAMM|nr:ATP-binding cassette domain-containing protein [Marinomonas rhizomae]RBP83421.1 ATP-binding cassette subfamily C protein LapB [Marinomonas rhizomae]RNF73975.1 ATP-binding cassette domain-containing protein [Marinomonas rhizomae]
MSDQPTKQNCTLPGTALHSLFKALGISVSPADIDIALQRQDIVSLALLDQIQAILHGLNIKGVKGGMVAWRRFDRRQLPALVSYDGQWWLAKNGEQADSVLLEQGEGLPTQTLSSDVLVESSVLWLQRAKSNRLEENEEQDIPTARKLILSALFQDKMWLGNVLVATVVINLLAIATSLFALQVYDRVVPTLAYSTLTTLVVGMLGIVLLDWMLKGIRAKVLDSLAADVDMRLSKQVFHHLLHLRLDKQPNSLGTLNAQVNGLESVRQFFTSGIVFGLIDLPFALMFIAFIAVIGGVVSWVYALLFPLAILLGVVTQIRLRTLIKKQILRSNERQGLLIDVIRGSETIRANNAGWRFSNEWEQITQSLAGYQVHQKTISQVSTATTGSLSTIAYVSAVVVGVFQIEAGNLTMGGMIACSILGGRVINPVAQGVQYLVQWQSVSQSLTMVDQLLALDLERKPSQHLLVGEQTIGSVSAEQVRFVYGDSPVKHLDIEQLTFNAGDRVLLVGPIGCGKSTLLKVLAGLYRPSEGRIKLGALDLWEIDPQFVTSHVSYLPQNVHLFKGTLKSNLTLSGTVSDTEMMQVATELGVDAIAQSSPKGMELEIAEGGEGLSGGQRQLVALSRTITAKPTVWLLDEPTASLDAESEKRVWDVLEKHIKPDDILIVSTHRPMLAAHVANRVLVMQQGKVIRDGAPAAIIPAMMNHSKQVTPKGTQSRVKRGFNAI